MSWSVSVVLLCEDTQHEVFVRAFLVKLGLKKRRLFPVSRESGDAKQFIRKRLPVELRALRQYAGQGRILIVMTDADNLSTAQRLQTLRTACEQSDEKIEGAYCFVPRWEIETWLEYLQDHPVNENHRGYPKLQFESSAIPLAEKLALRCQTNQPDPSAPPSLQEACRPFARMRERLL